MLQFNVVLLSKYRTFCPKGFVLGVSDTNLNPLALNSITSFDILSTLYPTWCITISPSGMKDTSDGCINSISICPKCINPFPLPSGDCLPGKNFPPNMLLNHSAASFKSLTWYPRCCIFVNMLPPLFDMD